MIDTAIADKIAKSSEKDPLVLNALQALDKNLPTQFQSRLLDWSYNTGILSYQGTPGKCGDSDKGIYSFKNF